jgi:two-component system sensor kinase FixL
VADTGTGIPPENISKLFEPLFTTKSRGVGLGLAIVKSVIEAHGGTITVESDVGHGSKFCIALPLRAEVSR